MYVCMFVCMYVCMYVCVCVENARTHASKVRVRVRVTFIKREVKGRRRRETGSDNKERGGKGERER